MTFPLQHMPRCIRDAAEGISAYTNAPPELSVMIALGEASLAIQGLYNATAHRFDGPSSLFIMVLNRSGGLKSQISKFLSRGRKRFEDLRLPIFDEQQSAYRAEYRSWELEKADAAKEKDASIRRDALKAVEKAEPTPPFSPKRVANNPSTVGLFRAFDMRGPSIGLFSTDAGEFLAGNTMADVNRAKEMMTRLAKLWSGEEIDRLTGEEQREYYNRRTSILWLVQNVMAEDFLANPAFQGQGILARMLVVPVPHYITPAADYADDNAVDGRAAVDAACNAFNTRIYELLMRDLAIKEGMPDELDPPVFTWSKDAKKTQQAWVNGFCASYRNGDADEDDTNKTFYERLEEHGARLATVFAIIDGEGCVSTDHAIAAHKLVEWITTQRRALDASATVDSEETRAFAALRTYLGKQKSGDSIRLSTLLRSGPRAFRQSTERVREACLRRADQENLAQVAVEVAGNGVEVTVLLVP